MEKLPKFQTLGMTLIMRYNEREVTSVDDDGTQHTDYHYDTAKICKTSTRDERVESIIKTKYPTYGAELAAMHKSGPENDEYLAFRVLAKKIADESFEWQAIV